MGIFGSFGLLLACIGVYSVAAYGARQRTREIGVRMALGADRKEVIRFLVKGSMPPILVGAVLGLLGTGMLMGRMMSILYRPTARRYGIRRRGPHPVIAFCTVRHAPSRGTRGSCVAQRRDQDGHMKSNRREFLSTCAAAGLVVRGAIAGAEAQNVASTKRGRPLSRPCGSDQRSPADLSRQRRHHAAAAVGHRCAGRLLLDRQCEPVARCTRSPAARPIGSPRPVKTLARFVNAAGPERRSSSCAARPKASISWRPPGAPTMLKADDEIVMTDRRALLEPDAVDARRRAAPVRTVRVVDVDDEGRPRLDQLKQMLSKRTSALSPSVMCRMCWATSTRSGRSARWQARSAQAW